MNTRKVQLALTVLGVATLAITAAGAQAVPPAPPWLVWSTVVNNNDLMPPTNKNFNSYNQPSVNQRGLVVIRARSRGGQGNLPVQGNQPVHGIYTRDMSIAGSPIRILDRTNAVPKPNNLGTRFVETPSFPRIDMVSDTVATRGNHQPSWKYMLDDGSETRAGTTGIYTNPFGNLITGASKLGVVPDFEFFAVPGLDHPTMFDMFPGAPAVTGVSTIVFKGNFTVNNIGKTGVFFRDLAPGPIVLDDGTDLAPAGGMSEAVLIANNLQTAIPGTNPPVIFGSTSPPSAANGQVVFAGFDDEDLPSLGGIYLAPVAETPPLTTLVSIGGRVPGESGNKATFSNLGEGIAFDGRYVGFWGAWGVQTRTVRLYCPMEGNRDRIAYCNQELVCPDVREPEVPVAAGLRFQQFLIRLACRPDDAVVAAQDGPRDIDVVRVLCGR